MKASRIFTIIIAATAWFAVALQFFLIIKFRQATVIETIIRYFSFFTILTNLLVALCSTFIFWGGKNGWSNFFSSQKTIAAITVYITVVGIIYNLVLRFLWQPQGMQMIVDELLHLVIPLLFILFWLCFVRKDELKWKHVFPWLIYPMAYIIFILLRGFQSRYYPYPFIDVNQLGYVKVFENSAAITAGFIFLSILFIAIGKGINRFHRNK